MTENIVIPTGYNGNITLSCPAGPIGPMGPTGSMAQSFINSYSITDQKILSGQAVVFDTDAGVYGNCAHNPNTSEIWVWTPGYYYITTTISSLEASQFSITKNDVVLPGSTVGSVHSSKQSHSSIVQILPEDISIQSSFATACKLQIINNTTYIPAVTIYGASSSGYSTPQITANINVILLCSTQI